MSYPTIQVNSYKELLEATIAQAVANYENDPAKYHRHAGLSATKNGITVRQYVLLATDTMRPTMSNITLVENGRTRGGSKVKAKAILG